MRRSCLACLLAAASLLAACGPPEVACSTSLEPSVTIRVVDSSGAVVGDALVTYSLDQGAEQQAECISSPRGSTASRCEEWAAGLEQPGTFTLSATSADGTRRATQTVSVQGGVCHVDTQQVQLVLPD